MLQVRITIRGAEGSLFSAGVKLHPSEWDQQQQRAVGEGERIEKANAHLAALRNRIVEVHCLQHQRYLDGLGTAPTPESIRDEVKPGKKPTLPAVGNATPATGLSQQNLLIHTYQDYIYYVGGAGEVSPSTLEKWLFGFKYLIQFLNDRPLSCQEVSLSWAKQYHYWLLRQPNPNRPTQRLSIETATRYVRRVVAILDHAVNTGVLESNPLFALKLPHGKTKEVYFLEEEHIARLFALQLTGFEAESVWWLKLICLTGLDYPDAVRYAQNRQHYERAVGSGRKLVIRRAKPPHGECHIPFLPELDALFAQYPTGPAPLSSNKVNECLRVIAGCIGFNRPLTCKIGRKSAGALFLLRGYRMEAVSRILGHASVSMTERHYVKITGSLVDKEMERLAGR